MTKRTITKNVETRVGISNEELIKIVLKSVNGPNNAGATFYIDDDSFHRDIEIVWWTKETEEVEE